MYDVEALLYVQEAQLDKFLQEISVSNAFANLAQHAPVAACGYTGMHECDCGGRFRGRGYGGPIGDTTGTKPTCQLYGKYGHAVLDFCLSCSIAESKKKLSWKYSGF